MERKRKSNLLEDEIKATHIIQRTKQGVDKLSQTCSFRVRHRCSEQGRAES